MTKKELRRESLRLMQEGKSKQEAFDSLLPAAGHTADELADIIRFVPSPRAREKYLPAHIILIIALVITVLLKALAAVEMFIENSGVFTLLLIILLPALNVWFCYRLISWQGSTYRVVGTLALLSLLRVLAECIRNPDILLLPELILVLAVSILSFFLGRHMVPPITETRENYTDELGRTRLRKKFTLPD